MNTLEYTTRARICEIESVENTLLKNDIYAAIQWATSCDCHARMAAITSRDYSDHINARHALGLAMKSWRIISHNTLEKSQYWRRATERAYALKHEIERERKLVKKTLRQLKYYANRIHSEVNGVRTDV